MTAFPYTLLDVFTRHPLAGNPLAVVHDADDLDDETMLAFARETRLSETTFVQTAGTAGATYRNRIWTIGGEIPFAGHPSLGTAVAVALRRGDRSAAYVQETRAGLQPVDVLQAAESWRASVLQEPASFGPEIGFERVLGAIGLDAADAHPTLRPQFVSTGLPTLIVPLANIYALARARHDQAALGAIAPRVPTLNIYAIAFTSDSDEVRARCFPTEPLENEDPATGSAAGALGAYLDRHSSIVKFRVLQGVEIGRASELDVLVDGERVRVSGSVVVIAEGTVYLPVSSGS